MLCACRVRTGGFKERSKAEDQLLIRNLVSPSVIHVPLSTCLFQSSEADYINVWRELRDEGREEEVEEVNECVSERGNERESLQGGFARY